MTVFDYLQIAILIIVVCVITTKAIYLRVTTGVNPIVIMRGQGAWRVLEILSLGGLLLCMTEVLLHALHSPYDLFPNLLHVAFIHMPASQIAGAGLVVFGSLIFVL